MDTKIRVELHALVEKLLHYNKPIIANSLMSWNAIELVVSSGISYVSSDVFAPYDAMFRPLNDRESRSHESDEGKEITNLWLNK
jgi:hypothetical protein